MDLQAEHFNFLLHNSKQTNPGMRWAWIIVHFCIIRFQKRQWI